MSGGPYIAQPWDASDPVIKTSVMQAAMSFVSGTFGFDNFYSGGGVPTGLDSTKVYYENGKYWNYNYAEGWWSGLWFGPDNEVYTYGDDSLQVVMTTQNVSQHCVIINGAQYLNNITKSDIRNNISAAGNGYTTTATADGTLTLTLSSNTQQFFTGTTTHTVVLPVASTMTLGIYFVLENNSTGIVTVNSSGANLVVAIVPGTSVKVTCILASGTSAASWDVEYTGFNTVTGTGANVLATSPTFATSVTIGGTGELKLGTTASLFNESSQNQVYFQYGGQYGVAIRGNSTPRIFMYGIGGPASAAGTGLLAWANTTLDGNPSTTLSEQAKGVVQIGTTAANALGSLACANVTASGTVRLGTYTVATLPSASANTRALAFVTDSNLAFNSTNLGSTVTAGGANLVPVFSNGTNWVIG